MNGPEDHAPGDAHSAHCRYCSKHDGTLHDFEEPLALLRGVRVVGEALCFRTGTDEVALVVGKAAPRWAAAHADPDLIAARLDDAGELARVATAHAATLDRGVPLWVVPRRAARGDRGARRLARARSDRPQSGLGVGDVERAEVRAPPRPKGPELRISHALGRGRRTRGRERRRDGTAR